MSALRKCRECGLEAHTQADLELFKISKASKHGRSQVCRKCSSLKTMEHRKHTSYDYLRIKRNNKIKALEYKGQQCEFCGIAFNGYNEVIFDFHHINPEDKEYEPSSLMALSWDMIEKELDKCLLLCSNCHRLEHKRLRNETEI